MQPKGQDKSPKRTTVCVKPNVQQKVRKKQDRADVLPAAVCAAMQAM